MNDNRITIINALKLMIMKARKLVLFILAGILFCSFVVSNLQDLNQAIPLGKAKNIKTLINIAGGEVYINKTDKDLALVKFNYDEQEWSPNVAYTEKEAEGRLTVKSNTIKNIKDITKENECHISLNKNLTYSLGLEFGAGLVNIDLDSIKIDKALFRLGVGSFDINLANTSIPLLKVEAGVGEAVIDLTGDWHNNLNATITAGIGEIKFIVPENVGVKFNIQGFLGDVDANGFKRKDKQYINAAYGQTEYQLNFDVTGAIGSVTVIQK